MLYIKLAWRNIWRNKRRTLITTASIVMAVLLSVWIGALQEGQYDQMIDNTVGTFTGHIQIQHMNYQEESTLDQSFEWNENIREQVQNHERVEAVIPRLESYALAAGNDRSRASFIIGIDVDAEKALSAPDDKIVQGNYFDFNSEKAALIAEGLANFLNLSVGDTLILLGQGFHGMSANAAFHVKGLVQFGIPEMNNNLVYLPLETAQEYYGAFDRVTAGIVMVENPKKVIEVAAELEGQLPELAVLEWQKIMPELIQAIEADRGSSYIILLIVYMVVGFGIFGTVLMMTAERSYEFGVMIAIGTARLRMSLILILEMLFITLLGIISGIILSLPFVYYFHINPLQFSGQAAMAVEDLGMEPFVRLSMDPAIFINQAVIVLIITLIISLYPVLHMRKLQPVQAMRA